MLAAASVLPPATASALTSTTINIDGDLTDWAGVRADPANSSRDTQLSDPDPDFPGQPDRDVFLVNATWDSTYLYLAFRRTSGGTKAIVFAAYIDRQGDGLLQGNGGALDPSDDVVVSWKVSQGSTGRYADAHASSPTAHIYTYNQAVNGAGGPYTHPGGDPMGFDGETPDGWADAQSGEVLPVQPMDGWMAPNGIEFEGKVAWADLGMTPGSLCALHFVNANGDTFGVKNVPSNTHKWTGSPPQWLEENRGNVEDNVNDIWWLRQRGVSLTPDNTGGGAAGSTVYYTHTLTNASNTTDTLDLSALSSLGWPVSMTDGGGSPLSSVTLGPNASMTLGVAVQIPLGTMDGVRDVTTIRAASRADTATVATVTDSTTSGRVTVTPDQTGAMAPGQTISYAFTVSNNLPRAGTYDLSALSSLGFPYSITDAAGTPISAVTLASGAAARVVVNITVPAGTAIGAQDVTRLTASLQGVPDVRASATAATAVKAGLAIGPNGSSFSGAGAVVDYRHTITNSWPATRSLDLTAVSSKGWPVTFFAADGVTRITSVTVGPGGAAIDVIARVAVPTGAAAGTVDTMTVTAAPRDGNPPVTATDVTTLRLLALYDTAEHVNQQDRFTLTDSAFGRAMGLAAASQVYFVWKDPTGAVARTSPLRTVDTAGMAFDDYTFPATAPTGGWTLELRSSKGVLLETTPYTVSWKARITTLSATNASSVGSSVTVGSSTLNSVAATITGSTMTYTIWWDANGDGVFGAGDTYIDASGAPVSWGGTATVSTHVTTGIDVAPSGTWTDAAWTVSNAQFPYQGNYKVTAVWKDSAGAVIDTSTNAFYSIPAMGWPLFLLAFAGAVLVIHRRTRRGEAVA